MNVPTPFASIVTAGIATPFTSTVAVQVPKTVSVFANWIVNVAVAVSSFTVPPVNVTVVVSIAFVSFTVTSAVAAE